MICAPALLPELFAESPVPAGPITDQAAEMIAWLLLEATKGDGEQAANQSREEAAS
jgi:hypothetical protein